MSIHHAIVPLRLIFWGGLLCVLDFSISSTTTINGQITSGYKFDFLNDFLGMLLVTLGIYRLMQFQLDGSYRVNMMVVFAVSLINCLIAFMDHFVFDTPMPLALLMTMFSIATLVATILFCTAMLQLADAYGMWNSSVSWRFTRLLVIAIWVVPFGLLNLLMLGVLLTGRSFHFNIGWFMVLALLTMLVPLVHLFISTSRMKNEAEQAPVMGG
ncbi:hypothetical protein [Aeoliella sp. SH292]|uniref:hypothetical protein n=1 Tax=Aeoliella sp. SH292 TaxID=3454464 RepID=UPI003F9CD00C